ncbi:MAG: Amuc_1100 family pilus-like protein [Opitutaceae bacterium]
MRRVFPRRVRAHPVFFAAMAVLVAGGFAGAAEVGLAIGRLRAEEAKRAQLRIECLTPQTRPEMIAAVETSLVAARARVTLARAEWPAPAVGDAGMDRLGAYAELVGYAERSRAAADAAGVTLEPAERFGFARFAQEAPSTEETAEVLAQQKVLGRVLDALFAAGPERLRGVWREATSGGPTEPASAEWCRLEATRSVRVAPLATTRAVRVVFEADTACLRRFLTRLVDEPGLVVREVAATAREDKRSAAARTGGESAVRCFAVTLEAVEVAQGGATRSSVARPEGAGPWRVSGAGRQGEAFTELFAPSEMVAGATTLEGAGADVGVELLAVHVIPYRWRLVGHVNGTGGGAAILEETGARRSVVLVPGEREATSGVTLTTLEVLRARHGGRVVRAVLADPRESKPVVLTTMGENGAARIAATLRLRGRGEPLEVAEGATVRCAGGESTVTAIRAHPAEVELTRDGAAAIRLQVAVP